MKFEIVYANAFLNYLLRNIVATSQNESVCGNCNYHQFLIDLLFIFRFENFPLTQKRHTRKLMGKVRKTKYNLEEK